MLQMHWLNSPEPLFRLSEPQANQIPSLPQGVIQNLILSVVSGLGTRSILNPPRSVLTMHASYVFKLDI